MGFQDLGDVHDQTSEAKKKSSKPFKAAIKFAGPHGHDWMMMAGLDDPFHL